jgi:N-acetylmuramoyl-L-alanine amidase
MSILADLMRRESANLSMSIRNELIGQLRNRIALSRSPKRSGPFRVLRQPQTPAVLIELGYMSNVEDEKLMLGQDWQHRVAQAIGRAIESHFAGIRARRHP